MTLLPPPPPSSERQRESSAEAKEQRGLPVGYHAQFEKVLQILKDRPNRYDKRRGESNRPHTTPSSEVSSGHSHLTAEGLRHDIYRNSQDAVEDELDAMKTRNPYAWSVINHYFDVDCGHTDYDLLASQAARSDRQKQSFDTLQMALYILVSRLMDQHLHVKTPAKVDTRTNRQRSTEEIHAEIRRVYDSWCKDLKRTYPKSYQSMARDNTALQCNRSTRTVQRALKFHDAQGEPK